MTWSSCAFSAFSDSSFDLSSVIFVPASSADFDISSVLPSPATKMTYNFKCKTQALRVIERAAASVCVEATTTSKHKYVHKRMRYKEAIRDRKSLSC